MARKQKAKRRYEGNQHWRREQINAQREKRRNERQEDWQEGEEQIRPEAVMPDLWKWKFSKRPPTGQEWRLILIFLAIFGIAACLVGGWWETGNPLQGFIDLWSH
jgi:hypothetical protein